MALSSQSFQLFDTLRVENTANPELLSIQQGLRDDPAEYPGYLYRGGLLFFKGRLVLPVDSSLRLHLLHEFHSSHVGGHSGIARTFHRLSSNFYWKNMCHGVKVFIASCQICQQMKDHHHHPAGLLLPLPIPEQVFEEITMDFVTCFPPSRDKTTIMTVVDRLSKYGHFVPLPATFTALTVVEAFVAHILKLHGTPKSIVTDRDPRFLHVFWQELYRLQGTSLAMSTAYHPQTDGQS
ncbi:hypothetical protein MTR67_028485 [Solanum verrucosum]|uniref:Integrase catalytic domain-containing protein n=1 Tax=Solanum verrucosum TaxID=315347 RepID=A0AAF0R9E7_SOLVR|nr:hypothetical protein MTR67_028485 [Solanum verrucosum]